MYRKPFNMNLNSMKGDREDEKRMLPCRYFVSGYCHKGVRCKFFHPNMHGRDPIIRVPDLPSEFHAIPQYSTYEQPQSSQNIPSLLEMANGGGRGNTNNRPRRMKNGMISPALSPARRKAEGYHEFLSPSSHAYSEYLTYAQHNREELFDDEDLIDDFGDSSDEAKPSDQNTVFNHIDWSEFLTPGVRPPPPTNVPEQSVSSFSPMQPNDAMKDSWTHNHQGVSTMSQQPNEDMPPEGSQVESECNSDTANALQTSREQKLSAKQELQMKVKQIAKELADEPIPHVKSLDSFFRNVKMGGISCNPNTTIPGSATCLLEERLQEDNKENEVSQEMEKVGDQDS